MAWNKYKVTNVENGQCIEGTAATLSERIGISKYMISHYAREGWIYKKKYQFQFICEKTKKELTNAELYKQWDEIHQIYLELSAGKRCIYKAGDGKRYAVEV